MHITNAKHKFLKFFPKTVGKAVEEVRRKKSYIKCSYVMTGKPSQYTVLLRKWQPTPALLPRNSHAWRSLVGYSRKETDTTEQLHFFTLTPFWGSFQPLSKETAGENLLGFHTEELTTPTPLTLV